MILPILNLSTLFIVSYVYTINVEYENKEKKKKKNWGGILVNIGSFWAWQPEENAVQIQLRMSARCPSISQLEEGY